jgi:hypothetical protein
VRFACAGRFIHRSNNEHTEAHPEHLKGGNWVYNDLEPGNQ